MEIIVRAKEITPSTPIIIVTDSINEDLLGGEFVPWIGSGISRDKFPDLRELLREVIQLIYSRINFGDPDDPYLIALKSILNIFNSKRLCVSQERN